MADAAPTDEELRERLTPEQYHITQEAGTEPAFTGTYWDCHDDGVYRCIVCESPLFSSDTKFESGTGWPSFYDVMNDDTVKTVTDSGLGMIRTEVRCANCGGHLGHVFPDGPGPEGLRFCINSAALDFEKGSEGDSGTK